MSLERNDPTGAFQRFRQEWERTKGKPNPDLCQSLLMLQDDPAEYRALVDAFLRNRA